MANTTILTLAEAKAYMNADATLGDDALQSVINAVASVIQSRWGSVDTATYTRVVEGEADEALAFPHRNITAVSSCVFVETGSDAGVDLSAGNLVIDAGAGIVYLKSGYWPDEELLVTYTVGVTPVPDNVKQATAAAVQNVAARRKGRGRPGQGGDAIVPGMVFTPDVLMLLNPTPLGFA